MGMRGSVQNSLFLDDVPVGPEQMLGKPGRGMEVAEDALTIGRLCIAAICLGSLKRCTQLLTRYGGRRAVASGVLLENPLLLATVGELIALIDSVGALTYQVARRLDLQQPVPPEIPMAAKIISSAGLNWAAGQLMQFLGGRGYMENNLAPQILRDARLWSVGEGASEPLTTQIGRKTRLTGAIDTYLRADPSCTELADLLTESAREVADRCLNRPGPFADRSSAQIWTDALLGQVASEVLLLAAVREAHRQAPSDALLQSVNWAEIRLARILRRAREGDPEERLIPTASAAAIAVYADSIGDVEQTLAGEEDTLDVYLSRTPGSALYPQQAGLPGHVARPEDVLAAATRPGAIPEAHSPDESRLDLLSRVLSYRPEIARAEDSGA
jgi:hypothetical protein